jgi:hypothetical protein
MTLHELIAEVNGLIDHNPNIDTHRDHIVRLINRHYEQICSEAPYRFVTKRHTKRLYADVSGTDGGTLTFNNGSKVVNNGTESSELHWRGQLLTGPDDVETRISGVDEGNNRLILESEYGGTTATSASWTLGFDSIIMPKGCVDILGVTTRDELESTANTSTDRRLLFVDGRSEENMLLDRTISGTPTMLLESEAGTVDNRDVVFTAAAGSTGASLQTSVTYEYTATLENGQIESPPMKAVQVTPTAGQAVTLTFTNASTTGNLAVLDRIYVYRRNVTANTGFYRVGTIEWRIAAGATTFVDTGFTEDHSLPLFYSNPVQILKVYKRPSTDIWAEIRYHRRPHRLVGDLDAPEMPPQFHKILVWKVVSELYGQYGEGSMLKMYDAMAEEAIISMRRKYLDRHDRIYRRGMWAGAASSRAYNYGVPSKT